MAVGGEAIKYSRGGQVIMALLFDTVGNEPVYDRIKECCGKGKKLSL